MENLIQNPLIWGAIAGGLATALPTWTFILTQFTKRHIDAWFDAHGRKLPTDLLAWFWAALTLILSFVCTGVADWRAYLAAPFIAVIAAMIAVNMFKAAASDGATKVLTSAKTATSGTTGTLSPRG